MMVSPPKPINYSPHFLFEFGGKLQAGEIWNCGVRCFPDGDAPVTGAPVGQGFMDAQAALLKTWFMDPVNFHASSAQLTWLKFNAIGHDGKYLNKNTTNIADIVGAIGGQQAAVPAFLSVAISWRTARTRPPGAFGRIYPPNYAMLPDQDDPAIISKARCLQLAQTGARLLDIVRGKENINIGGLPVGLPGFVPCVASVVDASLNIITHVSVGRAYDVQRNRKNAIPEDPTAVAYDWQH